VKIGPHHGPFVCVNVVGCVHTAISWLRSGTDDPQGLRRSQVSCCTHTDRLLSPNSVPLKGLITLLLSVVRCI